MALSLTQTTVNNLSGNYSPNITLTGYFDLTLSGLTTMQAPSGLTLTPQLIVISIKMPIDAAESSLYLTWTDDWKHWYASGMFQAYGGNWGLANCRGRIYTCLVGTGLCRVTNMAYWDPDNLGT